MKNGLSILGFVMFITGFIGLTLTLVGVRLKLLSYIDIHTPMLGFLLKLSLIVLGLVVFIISRTNWERENQH
ncbi:MAG: hypothetical protein JNK41_13260 [Saprospiraceae bacterium]|jgi:hypothetical protein|nr:hypothetical protein [Saprospiraceae bacterium]